MAILGVIKSAVADGVLTFLWVFSASFLGVVTYIIASAVGVAQAALPTLLITAFLLVILLFVFGTLSRLLGGAAFSPTDIVAFHAAGLGGPDSLFSAAVRFPAQAAAGVAGALAVLEVTPMHYKHMVDGPSLKVDLHTGAIAEGVLTFTITLVVLLVVVRGPANSFLQSLLLAMTSFALVLAGSSYTGPSMNPANAFGWAYVNNKHNTWEQFYVYWISPFVGAILAAWIYRFLFAPPPVKQKKVS